MCVMTRRMAYFAGLLVLIFVLAILLTRRNEAHKPYSSPTAIRTNDSYVRAQAPAIDFPPLPANLPVRVDRSGSSLTVTVSSENEPPAETVYGTITEHHAPAMQAIRIGDGSIRLAFMGMATKPPAEAGWFNVRVPGEFYTPDLKHVSSSDLRPYVGYPNPRDPHMFDPAKELIVPSIPGAKFFFACSNLADFKALWFRAFDGRTHFEVSNTRYGIVSAPYGFAFTAGLNLWHQTPIDLVGVVGTGPATSYNLAPEAGAELRFAGIAVKLLAVVDGELQYASINPQGGKTVVSLKIHRQEKPAVRRSSVLLYCSLPPGQPPIDFEAYDKGGQRIFSGPTFSQGPHLTVMEIWRPPADIQEVRVKHFPNLHRLVFTLPTLPGLPEENRNLKNLFDVKIPYLRLGNPMAPQQALAAFTQMEISPLPLDYSTWNSRSATNATNLTAYDLFQKLQDDLPWPYDQLIADPEKNEIRPHRSFFRTLLGGLRRALGGS